MYLGTHFKRGLEKSEEGGGLGKCSANLPAFPSRALSNWKFQQAAKHFSSLPL